jgi:hypothetical protein
MTNVEDEGAAAALLTNVLHFAIVALQSPGP